MERLLNHSLGGYQVLEIIGQGRIQTLYKCYHPGLGRYCALAALRLDLAQDPHLAALFLQGGNRAACLTHPNIIAIHSVHTYGQWHYIAMDYPPGQPLRVALAERGAFPLDEVLYVVRQVAEALDYAHTAEGVIHGSLGPEEVLIEADLSVTLTGFCMAGLIEALRRAGDASISGATGYTAPEQLAGAPLGPWTDLYALGALAYTLLAGHEVSEAPPWPPIQEHRPDLPASVGAVFAKALSADPEERYRSADALVGALELVLPLRIEWAVEAALPAAPPEAPEQAPQVPAAVAGEEEERAAEATPPIAPPEAPEQGTEVLAAASAEREKGAGESAPPAVPPEPPEQAPAVLAAVAGEGEERAAEAAPSTGVPGRPAQRAEVLPGAGSVDEQAAEPMLPEVLAELREHVAELIDAVFGKEEEPGEKAPLPAAPPGLPQPVTGVLAAESREVEQAPEEPVLAAALPEHPTQLADVLAVESSREEDGDKSLRLGVASHEGPRVTAESDVAVFPDRQGTRPLPGPPAERPQAHDPKDRTYNLLQRAVAEGHWVDAIALARQIPGYRDADALQTRAASAWSVDLRRGPAYRDLEAAMAAGLWSKAVALAQDMPGYRDADALLRRAQQKQEETYQEMQAAAREARWAEVKRFGQAVGGYRSADLLAAQAERGLGSARRRKIAVLGIGAVLAVALIAAAIVVSPMIFPLGVAQTPTSTAEPTTPWVATATELSQPSATARPTATQPAPTPTAQPSATTTAQPSATPLPSLPTATPTVPTATRISTRPPTRRPTTPVPPTATPIPPTDTVVPPTATPLPTPKPTKPRPSPTATTVPPTVPTPTPTVPTPPPAGLLGNPVP